LPLEALGPADRAGAARHGDMAWVGIE